MRVHELIKQLDKCDPLAVVIVGTHPTGDLKPVAVVDADWKHFTDDTPRDWDTWHINELTQEQMLRGDNAVVLFP
jgi:hypothetical protein